MKAHELPKYLTAGWSVTILHSHFHELAIGASNVADVRGMFRHNHLNGSFGNYQGNLKFKRGSWELGFDCLPSDYGLWHVALYSNPVASVASSDVYRVYALVRDWRGDQGKAAFCRTRLLGTYQGVDEIGVYRGLNFVHSAAYYAMTGGCDPEQPVIGWWDVTEESIPEQAKWILEKTMGQLETSYGQGKEFFKPAAKRPRRK